MCGGNHLGISEPSPLQLSGGVGVDVGADTPEAGVAQHSVWPELSIVHLGDQNRGDPPYAG